MKSGKKILFASPIDAFKVNGGAVVNYKNPRSVYFKATSWVSYGEIESLQEVSKEMKKKLKTFFKNHPLVHEYFDYNTIISLTISESRVKLKKPTFFDLDITLYQKNHENGLSLVSPKNKNILSLDTILQIIINDLFIDGLLFDKGFEYHYSIKEALSVM